MIDFSSRLGKCRYDKELTQKELAELIGVHENTIQLYENGKSEPKLSRFILLADKLGVSLDYLAGLTDDEGEK